MTRATPQPTVAAAQQEAAKILRRQIRQKPASVLGLATGSTPIGVYALLVAMHRRGELDFSRVTTFNLDEYVGMPATHEQSYRWFMRENLFRHLNVDPRRTHAHAGLGMALASLGRTAEASPALRDAIAQGQGPGPSQLRRW